MIEVRSVAEMKQYIQKNSAKSIGFVPTMGALHRGHLSLIEKSSAENDLCVVSIYLNETQFNDPKDLEKYPKSIEQDLKQLTANNVDCVFLPNYQEIYPDQYRFKVSENHLSLKLCGKDRPGHFDGVLTVVMKLLNIIRPNRAYFGEKDYQQLSLIQEMVKSFFMDTEIIACPTQRNEEGLALSSRNQRLSEEEVQKAQIFAKNLKNIKHIGELSSALKENQIHIDYLEDFESRRYAAVKIGSVRLIDNVSI